MMFLPASFRHRIESDPGDHLDANTLAAFSEHSLTARRRTVVFAHLAECDACRDWLASYSGLRDLEGENPKHALLSPFELLHSWQFKIAAGIACALILFAAMYPHLFRMDALPATAKQARLESALARRNIATHQHGAAAFEETISRAINGVRLSRRHSKRASDAHPALWSVAWVQPVLIMTSSFEPPRLHLPGPLGQARLTRNLDFAADFSLEGAMLPAVNQISVQTTLGKRWITLDRVSAVTRASF